ncbi:MAG: amidase family protein, partial [Bacteroidota bacterium]
MKRRDFITTTALAGVVSVLSESCTNTPSTKTTTPAPFTDDFELNEVTITELQAKINGGQYNSEELVKTYLERIVKIDKQGPAINSVIETNPDAIDIARTLDAERKAGKIRGPLHGIPILIKDNIDTA